MQLATIDASQSATGTDAATNLDDRNSTLNSYIIANYLTLTDAAHDATKCKLFFTTPEAIISSLSGNFHRYGGPLEEQPFMAWATRFASREAQRYEITGRILTEYEALIYDAIRQSLWTSAQDWSVEPQDVFWEITLLIFQKAHSLDKPGSAKLSTRIYGLVKRHCYLFHNARNTRRRNAVLRNRTSIDCEFLSDEELAAMKRSSGKPYDPGYSECGFSLE
jgi:hypothetical protein